ncbi:hypothetical protein [Streptomyces glaucescens]|uniref:Uncharacterized protein n=1 Tax=Streptomyces glaucescens TaxID=1907 RepID=A0A089XDQ1_STRGA|nr:hypothetical protein [Streptomyces glaucescens]AIS02128.1 hypothetical protein SGLAU_30970 [Streptomyces glaucescens]
MINESSVPELARRYGLTRLTAQYVLDLRARLAEEHPSDADAQEEAFLDAVRQAWAQGEPWAQEWAEAAVRQGKGFPGGRRE